MNAYAVKTVTQEAGGWGQQQYKLARPLNFFLQHFSTFLHVMTAFLQITTTFFEVSLSTLFRSAFFILPYKHPFWLYERAYHTPPTLPASTPPCPPPPGPPHPPTRPDPPLPNPAHVCVWKQSMPNDIFSPYPHKLSPTPPPPTFFSSYPHQLSPTPIFSNPPPLFSKPPARWRRRRAASRWGVDAAWRRRCG